MKFQRSFVPLVLAVLIFVPGSAQAGSSAAAVPGSQYSGYGTPLLITSVGGPILFVNADPLAPHDLVAWAAYGSDDQEWCVLFARGECPLFWSEQIPMGEAVPVRGLDAVIAGASYTFYCSLHPLAMKGTLIVLPA